MKIFLFLFILIIPYIVYAQVESVIVAELLKKPSVTQIEIYILLGIIIFKKQLGWLINKTVYFFTKKKNKTLGDRLDAIETKMAEFFSIMVEYETKQNKISKGTLYDMLFNEHIDAFKRLKAFVRLTARKINGRVPSKGMEVALENKEIWFNVVDMLDDILAAEKIVDQVYFDKTIEVVNQRINDHLILRK
jgi:hypothetical protein